MRTLRNAVERDKVHHAYLFVGSRGTGKTSMAKILAACLNCERGRGAPTTEPCGSCESCRSIAAASSLDVIEMDAASNNSVDDIRDLRESVAYAPVSGGRKVYILDEAHMLSTAAWNAFLKTLEEPPANTVFVLATTEAAKVPATVVDRCHRFDFHRPTVEQIGSVVRRVAESESIELPPEAIAALARAATGSFRDALGTLEQLVTYSGSEIALDDVLAVLGVADARLLADTIDAVAAGDAARALGSLEQCAEQGRDAASFAADLEVRLRELLVVQTLERVPAELSLTEDADAALAEQAGRISHATVVRMLELVGEAMEAVRAGADARTRLELALVKAARPEVDGSLRALLTRIESLESARAAGPRLVEARDAPLGGSGGHGPQAPAESPDQSAEPTMRQGGSRESADPASNDRTREEAGEAEPAAGADEPLQALTAAWPAVVELVRGENALLGALIAEARPVAATGDEVILAFATTAQFLKKKAEDPANRMTVGEAMRAITGTRWRLSYELREAPAQDRPPGEESEEDWVRRFMTEFEAEELAGEWPSEGAQAAGDTPAEPGARAVSGSEQGA